MSFFTDFFYKLIPSLKPKGVIIYDTPAMESVARDSFLQLLMPSIFTPNSVLIQRAAIERQAFNLAADKLKISEGFRLDTYIDSLGRLTVGIGHLVVASDNLKLGQMISITRVNDFFAKDVSIAFTAAKSQALELDKYTPDMIASLTEVNFQLGTGWRSKFPNTWTALKSGNWQKAVSNLLQSQWNQQTPNRVTAFIETIKNSYA